MRVFLTFALAASLATTAASQCYVEQIRLALTQATDGSEMGVSWATPNVTTPSDYSGFVTYGTSPSGLTMKTTPGDSRNYTLNGVHSPFLHFAIMTGLTPRTFYYYSIASTSSDCPASPVFNFTSPPARGTAVYPLRIAGYGDMGISYSANTATLLASRAASGDIDLCIHAGDISYADNRGGTLYETVQNMYWNEVQPYLSLVPGMFSSGNHEIYA